MLFLCVINYMKKAKQITIQITFAFLGALAILVGILGIVMPVLPGWPLIFVGFILISLEYPSVDNYLNNLVSKNKYLEKYYLKTRFWMRTNLGYELN